MYQRPQPNQMVKFLYKGKWYSGYYSECKDWFYRCNLPDMNFVRFKDIENWEPIA